MHILEMSLGLSAYQCIMEEGVNGLYMLDIKRSLYV